FRGDAFAATYVYGHADEVLVGSLLHANNARFVATKTRYPVAPMPSLNGERGPRRHAKAHTHKAEPIGVASTSDVGEVVAADGVFIGDADWKPDGSAL